MKYGLEVVYEDNHLLAVHKASGVLSQGDKTGDDSIVELAKSYLIKKYSKSGEAYIGLPHRTGPTYFRIDRLSEDIKSVKQAQ